MIKNGLKILTKVTKLIRTHARTHAHTHTHHFRLFSKTSRQTRSATPMFWSLNALITCISKIRGLIERVDELLIYGSDFFLK
jgi:hypothetical protein